MPAISWQSPPKRYGRKGRGEPPTPGGSNLITSTAGPSSRTKGSSSSSLAPMPLISSNGYLGTPPASFGPGLIATRSSWPPTVTVRISAVVVIGSGRGTPHRVALTAELAGALLLVAAPPGQPGRTMGPPAARHRLRRGEELV